MTKKIAIDFGEQHWENNSINSVNIYSKENLINQKPFDPPYVSCVSGVGQTPTRASGFTILLLIGGFLL